MVTTEVLEMERSETVRTLALEGVLDKPAEVLDGVVEGGAVLLRPGLLVEPHFAGSPHEDVGDIARQVGWRRAAHSTHLHVNVGLEGKQPAPRRGSTGGQFGSEAIVCRSNGV